MDEVLGKKTYINEEDLEKLEYIEQVLKETLRLHAPFSILFPKEIPSEGMTLNGYHIPGGTQVMVGCYREVLLVGCNYLYSLLATVLVKPKVGGLFLLKFPTVQFILLFEHHDLCLCLPLLLQRCIQLINE